MTKSIIVILLFALSFSSVSQQKLKYFDRRMIVDYKIKKIYEMISFNVHDNIKREMSRFDIVETDVGTPWRACRNDYFVFDERGNILYTKKKGREARFFYEYNQDNEMINYYQGGYYPFEDLRKTMDFKEYLGGDKKLFQTILTNYQKPFDLLLSSKIDYTQSHYYNIISSCSGIRAKYEMTVVEQKDGLPVLLKGKFVEYLQYNYQIRIGFGRDPDSREYDHVGLKYNENIYIYYYYEYFD